MMKTIDDIVREMRYGAVPKHQTDHELLAIYADRIEAAAKALEADRDNWRRQALDEDARANEATCSKSSQVGNAAKMREALKKLVEIIDECAGSSPLWWHSGAKGVIPLKNAKAALSAPARNCDLYKSEPEAYQAYLTAMKNATKKTYVYFEPWLFAEAKGEAK